MVQTSMIKLKEVVGSKLKSGGWAWRARPGPRVGKSFPIRQEGERGGQLGVEKNFSTLYLKFESRFPLGADAPPTGYPEHNSITH